MKPFQGLASGSIPERRIVFLFFFLLPSLPSLIVQLDYLIILLSFFLPFGRILVHAFVHAFVLRGKDAKNFEKRVKESLKLPKWG
jgi:hypothetical protein